MELIKTQKVKQNPKIEQNAIQNLRFLENKSCGGDMQHKLFCRAMERKSINKINITEH